jgi:hypothetical protein
MADVWIVLVEDRHHDVDAQPFSKVELAARYAHDQVQALAAHPDSVDWDAEITSRAAGDGVVYLVTYGTEGDCVSVIKRTMDGTR